MATSYAPNIVSDGIVNCWDAGSRRSYPGTGSTWTDVIGGQVGVLENDVEFRPEKGGYFAFDETDEYVNLGHVGFLSEGTIEMWLLYGEGISDVVNYREWGGGDYFEVRHSTAGLNGACTWDIPTTSLSSAKTSWTADLWYQGVWAWKYSTNDGYMFFNGKLDVHSTSGVTQDPSALSGSADMYAMRSSSTFAGNIPGRLAIFRIYNRVLSSKEVLQNYNATKWRFQ